MAQRLPEWLTIRLPRPDTILEVQGMMRDKNLHTVCESARCPNLPECWSKKTATFMILGDTCTRSCGFCAIKVGRGEEIDAFEPLNVAMTAKKMGMKHVVVTSVARDDMKDQGASQFAKTIEQLHKQIPEVIVEVHLGPGLPTFTIVGLPDAGVREAKDRVRAALTQQSPI